MNDTSDNHTPSGLPEPRIAAVGTLRGEARHHTASYRGDRPRKHFIDRRAWIRGGDRSLWVLRAPRGPLGDALKNSPEGYAVHVTGRLRFRLDHRGELVPFILVEQLEWCSPNFQPSLRQEVPHGHPQDPPSPPRA